MSYFFSSFFYIFLIILVSSLIQTKIKFYQSLSLSNAICLIALTFFLIPYKNLFFLLIFLIFIFSVYQYNGIKIKILNYNNTRFFWYSLFLIFFCYSRYFLDEDELTFWGINQKFLYFENLYINTQKINKLNELYYINYHSFLIPKFKGILNIFFEPREDFLILLNNLIILTCFFSLFKSTKSNLLFQFFYFLIFYCILNLLSFGFNSIYVDIIVVLFSILLFKLLILENYKFEKNLKSLIIFFLILLIPLIHRVGIVFIFIIIFNFLIFNYHISIFKKKILLLLFLSIFILLFNKNIINYSNYNLTELEFIFLNIHTIFFNYLNYIKDLIFYPTPYIVIFSFFNDSFNFFKFNFNLPKYNIIFYQLIIFFLIINFLFFSNKKFFFISLLNLFIFSFIVFLAKLVLEKNLHPYATVRYLMMFFLFDFVFKLSIKFSSINRKKHLFIIIVFLSFIVPSKSIGFILPQGIYLLDQENKNYFNFMHKLNDIKKNIDNNEYNEKKNIKIYVINNYTSLENSRIIYELYPKVTNKSFFSLEEFENLILDINCINIVIAKDPLNSSHSNYSLKIL
jgi:hypothetical protein